MIQVEMKDISFLVENNCIRVTFNAHGHITEFYDIANE